MPKSTREQLIRLYEQAQNDLDRCLLNLQKMTATYGSDYLRQTTMLGEIACMLGMIQKLFKQFRDELM